MAQQSTPPEEDRYKRSLVRILRILPSAQPSAQSSAQREIVGVGFLVDDARVITCAHVVAQALHNVDECPMPKRDDELEIDFPRFDIADLRAYVVKWKPYTIDPHHGEIDDIAVLQLTDEGVAILASIDAAARPQPADIVACGWLKGHPFEAYGYPLSYKEDGCSAYGKIQDRKFNDRYQIQGFEQEGGAKVQPGFSGAPVFDTEAKGVVGMVVQSVLEDNTATIIPIDVLSAVWDGLKTTARAVTTKKEVWREPPIEAPPPKQLEQPLPEPPHVELPSLVKILPGVWQIQITHQLSGMMGQMVLELFPTGTFQGQLIGPTGQTVIQGMWQITALNQLALQGQQSNGFMTIPYGVVLQFNNVTPNQLSGFSGVGEQVVCQKVR